MLRLAASRGRPPPTAASSRCRAVGSRLPENPLGSFAVSRRGNSVGGGVGALDQYRCYCRSLRGGRRPSFSSSSAWRSRDRGRAPWSAPTVLAAASGVERNGCVRAFGQTSTATAHHLSSNPPSSSRRKLSSESNSATVAIVADEEASAPPLTVEEQYSRKTPLEHVLLRPGMYVGPTERLPPVPTWVPETAPDPPTITIDSSSGSGLPSMDAEAAGKMPPPPFSISNLRMVRRDLALIPALGKVFDEILVNASDNRLRHPRTCTRIDVTIDPGCSSSSRRPFISVRNDGKGVPIHIHKKEGLYVPEMVFGHLLTGSNFDDDAKRVTGGRHGYGAKLANIFSTEFTVETVDSRRGLRYRQTWESNMTAAGEACITSDVEEGEEDSTTVSFVPDLAKLIGGGGNGDRAAKTTLVIPEEDYAVMCRRVIDVAGCCAVTSSSKNALQVTLNGRPVPVGGFEDYAALYRGPRTPGSGDPPPIVYQKINARWQVGIGLSDTGSFESVSFVNGMATPRGGTHVNAIVQQVTGKVAERIVRLHPDLAGTVSQGLVRRNLFVFVNALVENPTFDSQMKEALTSNPTSFGSKFAVSERFLNDLVKEESVMAGGDDDGDDAGSRIGGPGIVEEVARVARGRQQANLLKNVGGGKRTKRQVLSIPKLDDAHLAGTDGGSECTLILTEGDSAKALAVAGLEVIGRERYGVFPLRGKLLNVRDASVAQLTNNGEVKAMCAILGLDFKKEYATRVERADLRYGHVMLMTDQDTDGSHIKGLVMNFFRHFWPSLLKPAVDRNRDRPEDEDDPPFLSAFVTPLLKATSKKGKKESISFSSVAEYNEWRASLNEDEGDIKRWNVKYYKGLGTSTPAEAKEYFSAFREHHRPFRWASEEDGELLDMVFEKDRAADRREWITNVYDEASTLSVDEDDGNSISYEDFVNSEMIHFSNADNVRSLPSAVDGLKPSQRKVLYASFKRNLRKEIKVAQLAGYCAEHTAYHHGEASLHSTITGMAQDFVGSNNINLLEPSGQFGTRLTGGKDAASPRYIFTRLSPISRLLFPEVDDALLAPKEDDGQIIEPEHLCPIIPLLIVNGSQGIGTGWSSFIPPHNPRDVVSYIRAKLHGTELPPIRPWVRGFTGEIDAKGDGSGYRSFGKAERVSRTSVLISELPVGKWTNDYKTHLLKMRDKGQLRSFVEDHTTTSVAFTVHLKSVQLTRMEKSGLHKAFKLESSLPTTNMHAFDSDNDIQKFQNAEEIADSYFPVRLALYHDRKAALESNFEYSAKMLRNKADFIAAVTEGKVDLLVRGQTSKAATVDMLDNLGFLRISELNAIKSQSIMNDDRSENKQDDKHENDVLSEETEKHESKEFDYLLNMPLSALTHEKIQGLHAEATKSQHQLDEIKGSSPEDLWRADLDKLEPHL